MPSPKQTAGSSGRHQPPQLHFLKSSGRLYRPDISLVQLPTKEQATKCAQEEIEMVKKSQKGGPPSPMAWGLIGTLRSRTNLFMIPEITFLLF
jgi:hypothetical protein